MNRRKTMITTAEFNNLASPFLGMPISLPWRGHGSALFLELGELQPLSYPRQRHENGEACICLNWEWRIESEKQIVCGSSNSSPEIEKAICVLRNKRVEAITLDGKIPEITIDLSDGYRLRSMAMTSGYPQWSIRLPDGTYLSADEGTLILDNGTRGPSVLDPEESEAIEHADKTVTRWGKPISEPSGGYCQACIYFMRIDGHYSFLEYGVCTSEDSPFDGRSVHLKSGCQAFIAE